MNAHALRVLEFPRVLGLVAERATSSLGGARVRSLSPQVNREWIEGEHARVTATRTMIEGERPWHPEPLPDLAAALARLRVEGTMWSGMELLGGATLLRSSRRSRESLSEERRPAVARALLAPLILRLVASKPHEDAIE